MAISWCNKDTSNDLEIGLVTYTPQHRAKIIVLRMQSDEATNYSGDKSYPMNSLLFVDPDSDVAEGNYVIAKVHHLYTPICRKLVVNDGEQKLVPISYNQEDTTQYAENEFNILELSLAYSSLYYLPLKIFTCCYCTTASVPNGRVLGTCQLDFIRVALFLLDGSL